MGIERGIICGGVVLVAYSVTNGKEAVRFRPTASNSKEERENGMDRYNITFRGFSNLHNDPCSIFLLYGLSQSDGGNEKDK